jgi:hypothetical protein
MAYAQFTRREGLRDLIVCLNSQSTKLYHCGLRQRVSRSTLARIFHGTPLYERFLG